MHVDKLAPGRDAALATSLTGRAAASVQPALPLCHAFRDADVVVVLSFAKWARVVALAALMWSGCLVPPCGRTSRFTSPK